MRVPLEVKRPVLAVRRALHGAYLSQGGQRLGVFEILHPVRSAVDKQGDAAVGGQVPELVSFIVANTIWLMSPVAANPTRVPYGCVSPLVDSTAKYCDPRSSRTSSLTRASSDFFVMDGLYHERVRSRGKDCGDTPG